MVTHSQCITAKVDMDTQALLSRAAALIDSSHAPAWEFIYGRS
jgi:uncharacterized protein (DUF1778 family)